MWVVNKRIIRNLRANKIRWCAIFFMVFLSVFLVVSLAAGANISSYNHAKNFENNKARDGRFTTLDILTDKEIEDAEKLGFDIEKEFYLDYTVLENKKLRAFVNREKVDLVFCDDGRQAENENEVVVEKIFSRFNSLNVGDRISIGGVDFTISGIGGASDAEYVFDIYGETTDHSIFGNCYVTKEGYEKLKKNAEAISSETYRYGYRGITEAADEDKLENYLRDIDFDESKVENVFFQETLDRALKTKLDLEKAVNDMNDACETLDSSSEEFDDSARKMRDAADEFSDVVNNDLVSGITDLTEGVTQLHDNSAELNDGAKKVFDTFLRSAESSLAQYGINVSLTPENYAQVLGAVDVSGVGGSYNQTIDTLRNSLHEVENFCNGVSSYTSGVAQADNGSKELSNALSQVASSSSQIQETIIQYDSIPEFNGAISPLKDNYASFNEGLHQTKDGLASLSQSLGILNANSDSLRQGADRIFDLMLSDISSRLGSAGSSVTLTRDNYDSALNDVRNSINSNSASTAQKAISDLISSLESYQTFYDGIAEYTDGVDKLYDGLKTLSDATPELIENTNTLNDSAHEFAKHTNELRDGVEEFSDSIKEFSENMDELDEYFDYDVDIVETFEPLSYNAGIQNYSDKIMIMAIACGVLCFLIIAYIFTVFISHEIDNESEVIGALYSMGTRKSSLIKHYLIIPLMMSLIGGVLGTVLGLTPYGCGVYLGFIQSFYSMPKFVYHFDARILLVGIGVPVALSVIITLITINKKLSNSPLSMLRHERKIRQIKVKQLNSLPFKTVFRIKRFFSEFGTSMVVFFGMLLPMLFLMYSLDFVVSIKPLINDANNDVKFKNMYVMKYLPEEKPDKSEEAYFRRLDMVWNIGDCDVALIGIEEDTECFDFSVADNSRNTVSIGTGMARKYGLKKGDNFSLFDSDNDRYYTFRIGNVVDFGVGLYAFMNIKDMREVFDQDDDYYNTLVSKEDLDIELERVYALYTKDSIIQNAEDSISSTKVGIYLFMVVAVIVFFIITFLMIKLMIDRSKQNISLFKVFGYNRREISKLYIDGNFYLILISSIICMPIAKIIVDKFWFPVSNRNIEIGYNVNFPIWLYLFIVVSTVIMYFIISGFLRAVINKVDMSLILKNRE